MFINLRILYFYRNACSFVYLLKYHIQRTQHLETADTCSRLQLCRSINSDSLTIPNIFSLTKPISTAMESKIQENPTYGIVIILMDLSKATNNIAFP
jgi:hypothetical protein